MKAVKKMHKVLNHKGREQVDLTYKYKRFKPNWGNPGKVQSGDMGGGRKIIAKILTSIKKYVAVCGDHLRSVALLLQIELDMGTSLKIMSRDDIFCKKL